MAKCHGLMGTVMKEIGRKIGCKEEGYSNIMKALYSKDLLKGIISSMIMF